MTDPSLALPAGHGFVMFCRRLALLLLFTCSLVPAGEDVPEVVHEVAAALEGSVLPPAALVKELDWFRRTAQPLAGRLAGAPIRSCSEPLPVHEYERDTLAPLFTRLTGIRIQHDIIHEGEVVNRFAEQISTGRRIYHDYILDADNIGLIIRSDRVLCLSEFMRVAGKEVTNPNLGLTDFLDLDAVQDYAGNIYQLPDQSFPILYWYRTDWFADPDTRAAFQKRYGRALDIPATWQEYKEIAAFFTGRRMTNPDGSTVTAWGHLDYYRVGDFSLGWRIADVQLSNAGVGDPGLPNGLPVDEYGIRVRNGIPVGASVERGGALDSPAAVYALQTYLDWAQYAPPEARQMNWPQMARALGEGRVAQTIYFCSVFMYFSENYTRPGPLCRADGRPVWRMVPQPRGAYWRPGMKIGYKDVAGHTICRNVRNDFRRAAWLWAQFCASKAVALSKFRHGVTPIRRSTLVHPWVTAHADRWGGLVEFYLSPTAKAFSPTGLNVPHYPAIAALWYKYVSMAVEGTPAQVALTRLARATDDIMAVIELPRLSPRLNPATDRAAWLTRPGAPKQALTGPTPPPPVPASATPAGSPAPANRSILVVCAERFPDVYTRDNQVRGIQADFVRAALLATGYEPTIKILPIRRCMKLIQAGSADAMFPLSPASELASDVIFPPAPFSDTSRRDAGPGPILQVDYVVVTHADQTGLHEEFRGDLSALPNPVRVRHGDPVVGQLRAAGCHIEPVQRDHQNLLKLIRDRGGTVILPSFLAEEYSRQEAFAPHLYIHDRPVCTSPTFLAFSRKRQRIAPPERLRIWAALRTQAQDHVARNVAFAAATRAVPTFAPHRPQETERAEP